MMNIRFKLRTDKSNDNSELPIIMVIGPDSHRSYYTVPHIRVKPADWNPIKGVHMKDKMLNQKLQNLKRKADAFIYKQEIEHIPLKPTDVRDYLNGNYEKKIKGKTYFIEFANNHFVNNPDYSYGTRKNYQSLIKAIESFSPKILLEEMDLQWSRDFVKYFKDNHTENKNTISTRLKCIKSICHTAKSNGIKIQESIFEIRRESTPANKRFLSVDEVRKLKKYANENEESRRVIYPFLFCCFTGMRFGDMASLKWNNLIFEESAKDTIRLEYNMRKTKNYISSYLNKSAIECIDLANYDPDKYVFPVLNSNFNYSNQDVLSKAIESKNALLNKLLKVYCTKARLRNTYSWHESRHTFFCVGLELGIDVMTLKEIGGHSDIRMTQEYLKVVDSRKKLAMSKFDEI